MEPHPYALRHVTTKPHGSGMGLFLTQRLLAGRYGGGLAFEERCPTGTRAVAELGDRSGERRNDGTDRSHDA